MELFLAVLVSLIFLESTAIFINIFSKKQHGSRVARRKLFVDTSVLMDGRILSIAKAGFLGDELFIPRSVIRELQLLADGSDAEKRTRARFGLDVANELTQLDGAMAKLYADDGNRVKVDERLIELAKKHSGLILTNDFNLVKVAATEGISGLNVNDLAQGLRSEYLPGDKISVKIVGVGSNTHQGVAYLPDGTMVVVDNAERFANTGKQVEIEFVRYLQTNAGRMMFAKLTQKAPRENTKKNPKSTVSRRNTKNSRPKNPKTKQK